ncbi:MAG: hypothetical protein HY834_08360 [Devosia nanyangense]|uniref:DUF4852 domain-containing protein n=1 Tax=Devosia nanyangense TaxID=1228055 RepID=A0A933L0J6_9HYPH|nr:hypothetical protein [Devosia nanyangense]
MQRFVSRSHSVAPILAIFALLVGCIAPAFADEQRYLQPDFEGDYFIVKNAILAEFYGENQAAPADIFLDCHLGYHVDPGADPRLALAAYIADFVLNAKQLFAGAGYPQPIWRPALVSLESSLIKKAFDLLPEYIQEEDMVSEEYVSVEERMYDEFGDGIERIVAVTYRYNLEHDLDFPGLTVGPEGCGNGDDITVSFTIDPPSGKFRYINEYLFKVCSAKGDPYDRTVCHDWREGIPDIQTRGGNFRYVATWPDGGEVRSDLLVLQEYETDDESGLVNIPIRRE